MINYVFAFGEEKKKLESFAATVGSDNEEKYKFPFLCCFNKTCFFFLSTKFISFFLAFESAKYFATAGGAIVRPVSAFGEGFLVGFSLT